MTEPYCICYSFWKAYDIRASNYRFKDSSAHGQKIGLSVTQNYHFLPEVNKIPTTIAIHKLTE